MQENAFEISTYKKESMQYNFSFYYNIYLCNFMTMYVCTGSMPLFLLLNVKINWWNLADHEKKSEFQT